METTALKTLEVTIPAEYVSSLRKLIQGLGGKLQVRQKKNAGWMKLSKTSRQEGYIHTLVLMKCGRN